MPESIHHHTTPQFYLRIFIHPKHQPKLWKYDLENGEVGLRSPKKLAFEDDFYTVIMDDEPDRRVEGMFSRLETLYAPVVKKIGSFKNLSRDDLDEIGFFAATMFVRTHKRRQIADDLTDASIKAHIRKTAEEFDTFTDEEKAEIGLTREELLETLQRYKFKGNDVMHIKDMLDSIKPIYDELSAMPLEIFLAPPGEFFFTSDNPVSLISTDPGQRLAKIDASDKSILVTFPVSPLVCLVWGGKGKGNVCITTPRNVRTLNIRTLNAAGKAVISGLQTPWLDRVHKQTYIERVATPAVDQF